MVSVYQASFTGGEISPQLWSRSDLARWQTSLKTCRNFITQPYGGVKNRPGTRYVATTGGVCRLIPFKFNTTQNYVLEFGNLYIRVYKDSTIQTTVTTTYTSAEIFNLKYTQSADVMTIVHPAHPPMNLGRTSHTAWTLTAVDTSTGPFQDMNLDTSIQIYASAAIGAITITATKALFATSHVGRLIYI